MAGSDLPQLGLSSVTVLTGPDTCSVSESLINGPRGVGVTVNVVGGTTCGKPCGFIPKDNCGTTYYAIQFQGLQRTGLRGLWRWHRADLRGADDCAHQVGDESEARLAAAFSPIDNGVCPAPAFKASDTLRKAEASRVPYLAQFAGAAEQRWLRRP